MSVDFVPSLLPVRSSFPASDGTESIRAYLTIMLDLAPACLGLPIQFPSGLSSKVSYLANYHHSINSKTLSAANLLPGKTLLLPFKLIYEKVCIPERSFDAPSAGVEGDSYPAPNHLSHEGESAAE
jgi:hypothetical protein